MTEKAGMLDPRNLKEVPTSEFVDVDDEDETSPPKCSKTDEHLRDFKTHRRRAVYTVPPNPLMLQSFKMIEDTDTSGRVNFSFEYDFLIDESDTDETKKARIALWAIATMFEDTAGELEFTGGTKLLEVLMDRNNYAEVSDTSEGDNDGDNEGDDEGGDEGDEDNEYDETSEMDYE